MSGIYRADHIGSLLRPAELLEARISHANGAIDQSQLREVEDQSILQALELQRDTGMEVFTDGEYRRDSFLGGPPRWLNGFSDPEESFLREWHGPNGGMLPTRVRVVSGRLEAKGRFTGQEISFMKEHAPGPIKITMPAASMLGLGGFKEGTTDRFYESRTTMQSALSALIKAEAEAAIVDGVHYIQFDAPNYGTRLCGNRIRQELTAQGVDLERELDEAISADNAAMAGLRQEGVTIGFHVCRGNHRSRWQADGGYDPIAEKLFSSLEVDTFLLEYDTERAGGLEPLKHVPRGKNVVLGLITTKEDRLESQDGLLRRIEEATKYVPLENLSISPQCGFASISEGNLISWDGQRRKLELVNEIARKVWS